MKKEKKETDPICFGRQNRIQTDFCPDCFCQKRCENYTKQVNKLWDEYYKQDPIPEIPSF